LRPPWHLSHLQAAVTFLLELGGVLSLKMEAEPVRASLQRASGRLGVGGDCGSRRFSWRHRLTSADTDRQEPTRGFLAATQCLCLSPSLPLPWASTWHQRKPEASNPRNRQNLRLCIPPARSPRRQRKQPDAARFAQAVRPNRLSLSPLSLVQPSPSDCPWPFVADPSFCRPPSSRPSSLAAPSSHLPTEYTKQTCPPRSDPDSRLHAPTARPPSRGVTRAGRSTVHGPRRPRR